MIPKFLSGWGKIAYLKNAQSWAILLLKMVRRLDEFYAKFEVMVHAMFCIDSIWGIYSSRP